MQTAVYSAGSRRARTPKQLCRGADEPSTGPGRRITPKRGEGGINANAAR